VPQRILQIIPAPPNVGVAYYDPTQQPERYVVNAITCLALVENGKIQDVVYMETVDNLVKEVDTGNEKFLGLIDVSEASLKEIQRTATERYEKIGKPNT
jgi:hypothetical protein